MNSKIVIVTLALIGLVQCELATTSLKSASDSQIVVSPRSNGQISDAGRHILDKITKARSTNYTIGVYENIDLNSVKQNASLIVGAFMNLTADFTGQPCLTVDEDNMWRTTDNNCYAVLAEKVLHTLNGPYNLVIGEKAYLNVDFFFKYTEAMYEFFLGPLYFCVIQIN
ncbi:uncharacterized protein LOC128952006 [Oppia nitens]|uniref:uncharacterized protein LOC128952006 n=1 Tax=Oppia nitens TaxID=1686743 RepID=UPI0023DA6CFE|nr:uncharacterized protein LOC128952006 [Oppia nitens]